ncbi:hypothetical protein FOG48_02577 [Hanseniaspora uvarum]|nr:hypothetical protein FOG48_02577 [Hanseniaspora uvarum]
MDKNDRLDDIFSYLLNNTNIENELNNFHNSNVNFQQSRNTNQEHLKSSQFDDQMSTTYQSDDTYKKRLSNGDISTETPTTKYSNTSNRIELNNHDKELYKLTNIMEILHATDNINDFYRQISNNPENYHNQLHIQPANNFNTAHLNPQHNDLNQLLQNLTHQNDQASDDRVYSMDTNLKNSTVPNQIIPNESLHTDNAKTQPKGDNDSNYHNHLTEMAIESLKRQRNQSKLIHLDSVPDFQESKDVKIWLQKIFYPLGIEIAIERSDKCKITYKCKALKKKDEVYQNSHVHNSVDNNIDSGKKKRVKSQYNTCPFRIRAAYKIKRKKWEVVILNNSHSHQLKFNPDSFNYKQFKDTLREIGDVETIKKFDELEYKAQKNIPVDFDTIPCDCGLTEEVQSFGVVLPSSFTGQNKPQSSSLKKFAQKKSNNNNPKLSKEVLNKNLPISKIKKQSSKSVSTIPSNALENLTRDSSIEKESCNSSVFNDWEKQQLIVTSENNTVDSSIKEFNSLEAARAPESKPNQMFDFNMDINEIDFTELFLKPSKKVDNNVIKSSSENVAIDSLNNNDDITKDMNDLRLFDMTSSELFL